MKKLLLIAVIVMMFSVSVAIAVTQTGAQTPPQAPKKEAPLTPAPPASSAEAPKPAPARTPEKDMILNNIVPAYVTSIGSGSARDIPPTYYYHEPDETFTKIDVAKLSQELQQDILSREMVDLANNPPLQLVKYIRTTELDAMVYTPVAPPAAPSPAQPLPEPAYIGKLDEVIVYYDYQRKDMIYLSAETGDEIPNYVEFEAQNEAVLNEFRSTAAGLAAAPSPAPPPTAPAPAAGAPKPEAKPPAPAERAAGAEGPPEAKGPIDIDTVLVTFDPKTGQYNYYTTATEEEARELTPEEISDLQNREGEDLRVLEAEAEKTAPPAEAPSSFSITNFIRYYGAYSGLAGWSSLIFDKEFLSKWRKTVNDIFCNKVLGYIPLSRECWTSRVCGIYTKITPSPNGVLFTAPQGGMPLVAAHIEGQRSLPIISPNETSWVYTVTFSLTNPLDKSMAYNVQFNGPKRSVAWWSDRQLNPTGQSLGKGGTAAATGASSIRKKSLSEYTEVCLTFSPEIESFGGKRVDSVCNGIVQYSGGATAPYTVAAANETGAPAEAQGAPAQGQPAQAQLPPGANV